MFGEISKAVCVSRGEITHKLLSLLHHHIMHTWRTWVTTLILLFLACTTQIVAAKKIKKKSKIKHTNKKQTNTPMYSLRLGVDEGEEDTVLSDIDKLLAHGKKDKIAEPLQLLLRTAHQKITSALKDRRKQEARAAQRKAAQAKKFGVEASSSTGGNQDEEEAPKFTSGNRQSRELRAKAPKCNMMEYTSKEALEKAFKAGSVPLEAPFIVRNAVDHFNKMQTEWTSDSLRSAKFKKVGIKYYEPKIARVMMQQGGQAKLAGKDEEGGESMEVFEPQIVDFTEFFAKCFSKNKKPGPDTEHCEQDINALSLGRNAVDGMGQYRLSAFNTVGHRQDMDSDMYSRLYAATEDGTLQKLFGGDEKATEQFIQEMEKHSSRRIVFGPSGSGSSMRQESMPFADALVHGRRRWFLLTPPAYMKLKKEAGDDFTPGSAFSFFEDVYAELKEDFDMIVGMKHGIYECDQGPGDIVYVPAGLVRTSLTLADSISYKQELLLGMEQVTQYVDSRVWMPMQQIWNAAMCYLPVKGQYTTSGGGKKSKKKKSNKPKMKRVGRMSANQATNVGKMLEAKLGGLRQIGLEATQLLGAFEQQISSRDAVMSMLLPTVFTCKSMAAVEAGSGTTTTIVSKQANTLKHRCLNIAVDCDKTLSEHAKDLGVAELNWLTKKVTKEEL